MNSQPLVTAKASLGRAFGSIVWALSPLLSFGLLTPVTFLIAWIRRRTFVQFLGFAVYLALWIGALVFSEGRQYEQVMMYAYLIVLWNFATVHAFLVRRKIWYRPESSPVVTTPPLLIPEQTHTAKQQSDSHRHSDFDPGPYGFSLAHDAPAAALVASALLSIGEGATSALAELERRYFDGRQVGSGYLARFAHAGVVHVGRLAQISPDLAQATYQRAWAIVTELGAEAQVLSSAGARAVLKADELHSTTDPSVEYSQPKPQAASGAINSEPEPATVGQQKNPTVASGTFPRHPTLSEQVCDSQTYRDHVRGLRRVPDSAVVKAIIDGAQDAGGVLTVAEVGRIAGRPAGSVDGYVTQLQRALNIDGSQVLTRDDNGTSVRLNLELLRQQFLGGHQ
ncbi:hypothetical protein [Natronoglycomyces albus]|uniref:Alkaline phosphatase-like protein PglZ C-terminal domain-containing protein n=1 Tax=Natronoglycomyces albus TaxID=2811108 RepID=A0A895XU22_9ACTN|nr:hypothetical protein [Natronoglycomyces albus]QSB05148.1 hypothetical protein JQS30_15545 [Natronoglycomyces albus]